MVDWDSEDFTPPTITVPPTGSAQNRWEDEDKPEKMVPVNWDDIDEPKPKAPSEAQAKESPKPGKPKGKAKTKAATVKNQPKEPVTDPKEKLDKVRRERELQEKSDLENTKDLFSGTAEPIQKKDLLSELIPITEQDFEQYALLISNKIIAHENSVHYLNVLRSILRHTTMNIKSEDLKELGKTINVLTNEKIQKQKEADKKPKKKSTSS